MPTPTAVIIGDHTQGLGIVRSAAAAGAEVWVANDRAISLARFSRHLGGYRQLRRGTLTHLNRPECVHHLRDALRDIPFEGTAALFGVNEDITRFIYQNRAELRGRYFIPEVEYDTIYDKYLFNKMLPEAARIETHLCSEMDLDALKQPERFVLKSRSGNAFRQITGEKAMLVSQLSRADGQRLFAALSRDQVVVQEIIETEKPVYSVCSYAVKGRVTGVFGYEKLRQHPNRFGTGTYLRSTSVATLQPVAEEILGKLNYTGISEIEFIHDPRNDSIRVIEMNPRTWKSIHFATQCGQNLVARHLMELAGRPMAPSNRYRLDHYWTDLATDIPQMFRERKIWRYDKHCFECSWDRHDPLPAAILWGLFPLIALENALPPNLPGASH